MLVLAKRPVGVYGWLLAVLAALACEGMGATDLRLEPRLGKPDFHVLPILPDSFVLDAWVDPVVAEGGDLEVVASIVLGWPNQEGTPDSRSVTVPNVSLELREGGGLGRWELWVDGVCHTTRQPEPLPAGWAKQVKYQLPNVFAQSDGAYRVRIAGTPTDAGTFLRLYFQHLDRPVAELTVPRRLAGTRAVVNSIVGGTNPHPFASAVRVTIAERAPEEVMENRPLRDVVLDALDLSLPELAQVASRIESGVVIRRGKLSCAICGRGNCQRGPLLISTWLIPSL